MVFPAANLPGAALERGAKLVIINREPTPYDADASLTIYGSAGAALGAIATELDLPLSDA